MTLTFPAEIYELRKLAHKLNVQDPVTLLEEMSWVDTDLIRRVGEEVWGTGESPSNAQKQLANSADELVTGLLTSVQDRWEGLAYEQFAEYMKVVTTALEEEADRLPAVGSVLVAVADKFEMEWYEVVGLVLSAVGLILGVVSFIMGAAADATGIGAVAGLVLNIVGLILAAVSLLVAYFASVKPRLDAAASAATKLDRIADAPARVDELGGDDVPGRFPGNPHWWNPRNPDRYS